MRVGYKRVSTFEQNPDRQLEGIVLDKVYIDYASGKTTDRPQFENMCGFIRKGDILIVHSMDRLARNVDHLRKIVKTFTEKGITIEFIKENLKFTGDDSPMSNLLLTMMGAFSELEIGIMDERRREGIELAKKQGKYAGRKKKLTDEKEAEIRCLFHKKPSVKELANQYGVCTTVIYELRKKCINE